MSQELSKLLREELSRRRSKNGSYSLRAFASWLDLSPSSLSEMIAGKRQVSPKMAKKLSGRLGLSREKTESIVGALGPRVWIAKKPKQQYVNLENDQFDLISSWVHFAILSALRIREPNKNKNWMAKKLRLSEATVLDALTRLKRLGLVEEDAFCALSRTPNPISSSDHIASMAIQKSHRENLELASQAIQDFSVDERDFTSITMAINPKKIPEAKNMIRAFRDRLAAVLEDGEVSEVYRLSVQFFPLKGTLKQ